MYRNCSKYITLFFRKTFEIPTLHSSPMVSVGNTTMYLQGGWCYMHNTAHHTCWASTVWELMEKISTALEINFLLPPPPFFHCFSSFPCWPNSFPLVSFRLSVNLWAYGFSTVILCQIQKLNVSQENTASWERCWLTLQGLLELRHPFLPVQNTRSCKGNKRKVTFDLRCILSSFC